MASARSHTTCISLLPYPVDYEPYDATHIVLQLQLLFFSALAFVALKLTGIYPPELRSANIDVDWTYRKLLPGAARLCMRGGCAAVGWTDRLGQATGIFTYRLGASVPRTDWRVRTGVAYQ